jgi:hypothetical protein
MLRPKCAPLKTRVGQFWSKSETSLNLIEAGFASTWITRWRRRRRSIAAGEPATAES